MARWHPDDQVRMARCISSMSLLAHLRPPPSFRSLANKDINMLESLH